MRCFAVALVLLGGCNDLLGVHEFAANDAPPALVHAHVVTNYLRNQANGSAIIEPVDEPIDSSTAMAYTVELADGTPVPIAWRAPGQATFEVPDGATYRVRNGIDVTETDLRDLVLGGNVFGRADRVPITRPTTLQLAVANQPGGASVGLVYSSGIWSTTVVSPPMSEVTIDWTAAAAWSPPIGALSARGFDELTYAAYANNLDGSAVVIATGSTSFDLNDGASVSTGVSVAASQAPPLCFHVFAPIGTMLAKLGAIADVPNAVDVGGWNVFAIPIEQFDANNGRLYIGRFVNADTDATVNAPPAWGGFARVKVLATYLDPKGVGFTITTTTPVDNTATTCGAATAPIAPAVPSFPTLGGVTIGATPPPIVLDRTHRIALDWTDAIDGPVDLHTVLVFHVTANGDVPILHARTIGRHFDLDPALFVTGEHYEIELVHALGRSAVANGDFLTNDAAQAIATTRSGAFDVMN